MDLLKLAGDIQIAMPVAYSPTSTKSKQSLWEEYYPLNWLAILPCWSVLFCFVFAASMWTSACTRASTYRDRDSI